VYVGLDDEIGLFGSGTVPYESMEALERAGGIMRTHREFPAPQIVEGDAKQTAKTFIKGFGRSKRKVHVQETTRSINSKLQEVCISI
jgi:hypothetical protein